MLDWPIENVQPCVGWDVHITVTDASWVVRAALLKVQGAQIVPVYNEIFNKVTRTSLEWSRYTTTSGVCPQPPVRSTRLRPRPAGSVSRDDFIVDVYGPDLCCFTICLLCGPGNGRPCRSIVRVYGRLRNFYVFNGAIGIGT